MAGFEVGGAPIAAVLVGRTPRLADAREAVAAVGGRVVVELGWDAIGAGQPFPAVPSLIVVEACGESEDALGEALPAIGERAAALDAPIVVSLAPAAIDVAAATLMAARTQLLCEPSLTERTLALALAGQSFRCGEVHDTTTYEGEALRLKRLNEEVARIAETLSRLARREAGDQRHGGELADKRQAFGAPPLDDITIDAGEVRRAIRARRMRDQHFGAGIFEEPAWDMLLDLFAAELEQTRVSVSSLCIAAAVAPTTALRWISKLTDAGLFERQPDPLDRRRAYMELSDRASRAMRSYVGGLRRAGLSLA